MAKKQIDTAGLLRGINIVDVIDAVVPLKKNGPEFEACCPFHTEATPSFKVSESKQFYHCFGCGANGDAIKFLQEYHGYSFVDACRALGARVDGDDAKTPAPPLAVPAGAQRRRAPEKIKKESLWEPLPHAPADAPEPPRAHIKRGLPERVWCYRGAAGEVLGYVYRFITSNGGKEVLPLTWCRHKLSGALDWHWMSFAEPRPLYGLDRLAAKPDATVLLVEGEKCADSGTENLPHMVVVSWPGGGKAIGKVDWTPLAGRRVVLWADCDAKRVPVTAAEKEAITQRLAQEPSYAALDEAAQKLELAESIVALQATKPLLDAPAQPGIKAMTQIAAILAQQECELWSVEIPTPGEVADGWDIADAVAEGICGPQLAEYIRARAIVLKQQFEGDQEVVSTPATPQISETTPTPKEACASQGAESDGWRKKLLKSDGVLIDCRENIYLFLKHHPKWRGVLWVDEFAHKVVKRSPAPWDDAQTFKPGTPWGEDEDLRLGMWLAQQPGLLVRSAEALATSVGWVARESRWHPVREYLDGLVWDGVERLPHWLHDFLGLQRTEYAALSGKLFLIGMVARIYEPGCQMRSMPILEGTQFRGKSTALRILGGEWFSDANIDLNNKDSYQLIQGKWLYEIAELDAFNRAESTRIKAFISSCKDRFRAPYDRAPRDWVRQTVFCGSTNQSEYFKDQTGNTRYWPWLVEQVDCINLDGLTAVRDQLFAEAVARYKNGERWHPTSDEQRRLFEPEQESREIGDLWQPIIAKWLRTRTAERVTATEIICDCLEIDAGKIDSARQMSTRIGIAMKRLGWHKERESGGAREYYYVRPAGWNVANSTSSDGGDHVPF